MNRLEHLEQEAFEDNIKIHDYYLGEDSLKGLYIDGNIAINTSIKTSAEKTCVLAEELGHHYTSVGNIIDMSVDWNRKQERQARFNAYERLIGLFNLVKAYEDGCRNRYEIAKHLEVTEEFLQECIDCYRSKYGIGVQVGDYYLMFIPYLSVGKMID